jgi:hypothetical protein
MENIDHIAMGSVSIIFLFGLLILIAYTTYKDAQDEQLKKK